jgi:beta-glucanase (GH16 family)
MRELKRLVETKTVTLTAAYSPSLFCLKLGVSQLLLVSIISACVKPVSKPTFADKEAAVGEGEGEGEVEGDTDPTIGEGDSNPNTQQSNPPVSTTPKPTTGTGTGTSTGTGTTVATTPSVTPTTPTPTTPTDGTPAIGSMDNGWKLVWSDEFNGSELDESKWSYEVQKPRWVNDEWQGYTNKRKENVRLEGGHLVIEARRDNFNGQEYTSGRIKTQGKHSWKYGRIEASIKLPGGLGTWPAFWMMPENQSRVWPGCGEIDIMEEVGHDQDTSVATTHTQAYNWANNNVKTATTKVDGITSGYHTYALQWYADRIEMYVDGRKYYTVNNEGKGDDAWPFDKNFHIIFNLAVGGVWGGSKGVDGNIWPRAMLVDWVRVYQK